MLPMTSDTSLTRTVSQATTSVACALMRRRELTQKRAAEARRETHRVMTQVYPNRRRSKLRRKRSHPEGVTEVDQDVSTRRDSLRVNPSRTTSIGRRAVANMPPMLDLRKKSKVVEPLNDLFTKAVDFKSYRLANRRARYDSSVASKIEEVPKQVNSQMKTQVFSGKSLIAVVEFLASFKTTCDHSIVSNGAAVWCSQFYPNP